MYEVIIVGAGISGLRCALELETAGVDYIVLEKDSYVGGRCSSHFFDGYILDRGFQILLDSYEEVCLLYTSPSPRDATLSRMPSSA